MQAKSLIVPKPISFVPEFKIPRAVWKKNNFQFIDQQDQDNIRQLLVTPQKSLKNITRQELPKSEDHAFLILLAHYDNANDLLEYAQNTITLNIEKILVLATQMGRLDVIKEFKRQNSEVEVVQYPPVLGGACEFGHTHIFDWVEAEDPEGIVKLIDSPPHFSAFKFAAACGATNLLERMKNYVTRETLLTMMKSQEYIGFGLAARNGHLSTLEWYKEQDKENVLDMVKSDQYFAFRNCLQHSGNLLVSDWLLQEAANNKNEMLSAALRNNGIGAIFEFSSLDNPIDVLEYLKKHSTKDQWSAGLSQFHLPNHFTKAYGPNGTTQQKAIIKWVLLFPPLLSYAIKNEEQFKLALYPFITDTIGQMRVAQQQAPRKYDITDNEMQINCFYMLMFLIKRNDPKLNGDIEFLLTIPSVRRTKATANEAGQKPNQLLSIALTVNNTFAADLLNGIPEVQGVQLFYPIAGATNPNTFFNKESSSSSGKKCVCKSQCLLCMISNGGKARDLYIKNVGKEFKITMNPATCSAVGVSMELEVRMNENNTFKTKINTFEDVLKFFGIKEGQHPEITIDGQSYFEIKNAFESENDEKLQDIFTKMDAYRSELDNTNQSLKKSG